MNWICRPDLRLSINAGKHVGNVPVYWQGHQSIILNPFWERALTWTSNTYYKQDAVWNQQIIMFRSVVFLDASYSVQTLSKSGGSEFHFSMHPEFRLCLKQNFITDSVHIQCYRLSVATVHRWRRLSVEITTAYIERSVDMLHMTTFRTICDCALLQGCGHKAERGW
jgi:hypothetical protein